MSAFLLVSLLASPSFCPQASQLRWDAFPMHVSTDSGALTLQGRLYDRDGNGKPSSGDLYHLDSAKGPKGKMNIDQPWMLIEGELAKRFTQQFSKVGPGLQTRCDTQFQIEDVPAVSSDVEFSQFVFGNFESQEEAEPAKKKSEPAVAPPSRIERLNTRMRGWAKQICDGGVNVAEKDLINQLMDRTREAYPKIFKRSTMRREATDVAKTYSLKCVKFSMGKLTF
jgi:hypothetical protein